MAVPQPNNAVVHGVITPANATALKSITGGAPAYVFTSEWTLTYRGQTLSFRPGIPYPLDAQLLAALTAARALMEIA